MPDARQSSGSGSPESAAALGVELGAVIAGKYRVERVLGQGGMGVVVAASQLALDRLVAIKLVRKECAGDPLAVERLLREAKAAASIKSEHVARVLDVGTLQSGVPFIVMEYLEGSDLQSLLEREGPLPVADAVDVVLEACEAIAEAHRNGIVHRDIKPANVLLSRLPGGVSTVKVVDFGISKLMHPGAVEPLTLPATVVGSLYHMSPEQMRGGPVDARSDVWALGLLLFELITGRKPFRDQAWPAVCAQVLHDGSPLLSGPVPGMSPDLVVCIERCLRRQPEDRYGNVAELAVALCRFGTRRAHASLERIVLLATSTGSLAAAPAFGTPLPSTSREPVAGLDRTRAVVAPAATPAGPVTPSTPLPVSSSRREPVAASRVPLVLAAAAGLGALGSAYVWLWPEGREAASTEEVAPLQPAASSAGAPVEPAAAARGSEPDPAARAPSVTPVAAPSVALAEAPSVAPLEPREISAAASPPPSSSPRPAARGAREPVQAAAAVGSRPPALGAEVEAPAPPAPAPPASEAPPPAPAAPGSEPPSAELGAEAPAPAAPPPSTASPPPPPPPPRPRAPSPWDLSDIEFRHDGR